MRQLLAVYHDVKTVLPDILKKRGAKSCYEATVFRGAEGGQERS
jgi:hypothetical protein